MSVSLSITGRMPSFAFAAPGGEGTGGGVKMAQLKKPVEHGRRMLYARFYYYLRVFYIIHYWRNNISDPDKKIIRKAKNRTTGQERIRTTSQDRPQIKKELVHPSIQWTDWLCYHRSTIIHRAYCLHMSIVIEPCPVFDPQSSLFRPPRPWHRSKHFERGVAYTLI